MSQPANQHATDPVRAARPLRGWVQFEMECEDGSWDGYATSYDPRGQSIHAHDAVEIREVRPGEICITRDELKVAFDSASWKEDGVGEYVTTLEQLSLKLWPEGKHDAR